MLMSMGVCLFVSLHQSNDLVQCDYWRDLACAFCEELLCVLQKEFPSAVAIADHHGLAECVEGRRGVRGEE